MFVNGMVVVVGMLTLIFLLSLSWRRKTAVKEMKHIEELDSREVDLYTSIEQLRDPLSRYTIRYAHLQQENGTLADKLRRKDTRVREEFEKIEQDHAKFLKNDYDPMKQERSEDFKFERGQTNLRKVHRLRDLWPVDPPGPAEEIKAQLKEVRRLTGNLTSVFTDLEYLRKQIFPEGSFEELEVLPCLVDKKTEDSAAEAGADAETPTPETQEAERNDVINIDDPVPQSGAKQDKRQDQLGQSRREEEPAPDTARKSSEPAADGSLALQLDGLRPFAHPLLSRALVRGGSPVPSDKATGEGLDAVVLDRAGWVFIGKRNNPRGGGGLSERIYEWLGISDAQGRFPSDVHNHFSVDVARATGRAKFCTYRPGQHVIHCIDPGIADARESVYDLAQAYYHVFSEFCVAIEPSGPAAGGGSVPRTLRLEPLSSGGFSVDEAIRPHLARLTWCALSMAFAMLPGNAQEWLGAASFEFCLREHGDVDLYERELEERKACARSKPDLDENCGRLVARGGTFEWVRRDNAAIDRFERLASLALTEQATRNGGYMLPRGRSVELSRVDDMLEGTRPREADGPMPRSSPSGTRITWAEVGVTVIEAAVKSQNAGRRTCAVNAASTYSVGGGVTSGGRHALEESMCIVSTLLTSLRKASSRFGVSANNSHNSRLQRYVPVEGCIVSPHVEVFRKDDGLGYEFLETSAELAGVISVAMFNINTRVRNNPVDAPENFATYCRQVRRKFKAMFCAAADLGAEVIVCPDIGCGAFGNDHLIVGALLGSVLREFPGLVSDVVLTGPQAFWEAAVQAQSGQEVLLKSPEFFGRGESLNLERLISGGGPLAAADSGFSGGVEGQGAGAQGKGAKGKDSGKDGAGKGTGGSLPSSAASLSRDAPLGSKGSLKGSAPGSKGSLKGSTMGSPPGTMESLGKGAMPPGSTRSLSSMGSPPGTMESLGKGAMPPGSSRTIPGTSQSLSNDVTASVGSLPGSGALNLRGFPGGTGGPSDIRAPGSAPGSTGSLKGGPSDIRADFPGSAPGSTGSLKGKKGGKAKGKGGGKELGGKGTQFLPPFEEQPIEQGGPPHV
jgi:uncharacterized protein (TIGR02452 family)